MRLTDCEKLRAGDRVRLSREGVDALLGEIICGRLPHGLRRRSCNNRKLTDMSRGIVLSVVKYSDRPTCARVKWDEMKTERTIYIGFLRRIIELKVIE